MVKKQLFILMLFVMLLPGCVSYDQMLKKIPKVEFESFSYHRGGNTTSASISATNAVIEKGVIEVEYIHIIQDWGPFLNFDVQLRGYRRKIK